MSKAVSKTLAYTDYVDNQISILSTEIEDIRNNGVGTGPSTEQSPSVSNGIEPQEDDIPKVFIDGNIPSSKSDVLATLTYVSKTQTFTAYITIKCQGTSSLSYPKKNFTVKLYKDIDRTVKYPKTFKNWTEQNKFCLKANWMDLSHARNLVSARIWGDVVRSRSDFDTLPEEYRTAPNVGAVDGFPIRVFCNGVYWGRYTWNIPKDAWMANMDASLDNHCILCGEDYSSSCFRSTAVIDKTDWTDEIHDTVPATIRTNFNKAINFVMDSPDSKFVSDIGNYFNLQSLIDYYLFSYAICHLDGLGKNQLLYTYDGKTWIAGAYDLDSTWGLYWDGSRFVDPTYRMQEDYETAAHNTSNLLYDRLSVLFADQIKERWNELSKNGGPLSMQNIIQHFEAFTDICPPYVVAEDYATTTGDGKFTEIPSQMNNNIGQIRDFAAKRLKYVDTMINPFVGDLILRENYSPAGSAWVDTVTNINFDKGDYIEASIDLSTVSSTSTGVENILSIGESAGVWSQNGVYHTYYNPKTKEFEVNSIEIQGTGYNTNRQTVTLTDNNLLIKVDINGIYINGNLITTNDALTKFTKVEVGSAEGAVRSTATYNYIKVVYA